MTARTPLYLSESIVQACLSDAEVYNIVSHTLSELSGTQVVKGPKSGFGVDIDGEHVHMGSVSGCLLSARAAGIKWFMVLGKSRPPNVPRVPATILVYDAKAGVLDGVLDAAYLTCRRTAAMAVAAAFACGGRPLNKAAVIGAGHIGCALVRCLATTQSLRSIAVASREESSARHACEVVVGSLQGDVTLHSTSDIRQAVSDADVVFTATNVSEPTDLVRSDWLQEHAVVCSLGSQREVDFKLISQAWIVVDDPEGLKLRNKDFREGGVGWGQIAGDLGSLISGQLRPPEDPGKVFLILAGLGVLDVALGARAIANARREGLGVPLEPPPA
ncbi:NAD(P)-binding domain-containing protein [Bradyrhizobium arachidis]|uniref:NAD(P)-binding domain-containing protein n=1 Tax=Bradyrhizobium arachidis TaxID=858423 RepID=UPI0021632A7E|nr:NAD(P)-binding domain-containing protein [Bradyrhizobium arachidis]UVO35784.1 NAD(P)-binding domain-containing protein [Bradyrhizobium arachidis]